MSQSSRFNTGIKIRHIGEKGDKGDKGDKGAVGDGINIKGVVDSSNNLPNDANIGDVYFDNCNNNLWIAQTRGCNDGSHSNWYDGSLLKEWIYKDGNLFPRYTGRETELDISITKVGIGTTTPNALLDVNGNVTAHTITAQNYAVDNTNFISASRQGNFRDIEVKNSNNQETIMLTGDGGNIELDGTLTVDNIGENTNGSGVTIENSLIVVGDLSVNGNIYSSGGLVGGGSGTGSSQNIQLLKVFDDISATSVSDPSGTTPWISQNSLSFDASSILFHNIKTSGYVADDDDFTWPLGGHQWILRRGNNSNTLGWNSNSSSNILRHTFNTQGEHEHENFSFIEEITSDVSYSYWQCDFSGSGARNNNDDKITWTIANISSSTSFNYVSGSGSNSEDASFDNIGSYTTNSNINLLNDVSVNGGISAECFHFQGNWNSPSFSGHLIPTEHEVFDIGSAGNKIRHLFLSDNTLWIGDENKLSIKDGNIKFRKLKKETGVLPSKLGNAGADLLINNIQSPQGNWGGKPLNEMKLSDWENFINNSEESIKTKLKNAGINIASDIFNDDNDEDLKDDIVISDISSSGVSKFTDVSINKHLSVPDASFNNIGSIDGSLVVLGDLSVNGNIYSALDEDVVKLTGDQTIAGVKTFNSVPVCSTQPSSNTQLANKQYVDATAGGGGGGGIDYNVHHDFKGSISITNTEDTIGYAPLFVQIAKEDGNNYQNADTWPGIQLLGSPDFGNRSDQGLTVRLDGITYIATMTTSSDDRLKSHEEPIINATDIITQINGVKYKKHPGLIVDANKEDTDLSGIHHFTQSGVIAQNILDISGLEHIVQEGHSDTDLLSVDYNGLIPYLIEAIKEMKIAYDTSLNNLLARITALENA